MNNMPKESLNKMIDVIKAIEPEIGYGAIMQVSQTESKMREERIKKTKTVCLHLLRRWLQLRYLDQGS